MQNISADIIGNLFSRIAAYRVSIFRKCYNCQMCTAVSFNVIFPLDNDYGLCSCRFGSKSNECGNETNARMAVVVKLNYTKFTVLANQKWSAHAVVSF